MLNNFEKHNKMIIEMKSDLDYITKMLNQIKQKCNKINKSE
jgi:hypothetical protein